MKTTDYLREGYRQLEDINFYQNFEYLNIKNPTEARFYLLPKIHKKDIHGRPICSSINHPTCNISKFVDEHIKQYVPKTKLYVRDTQHIISRLKELGKIPQGALIVTLDVSSMYTNIPNHEGILAVAEHLRRDPEKQKNRSTFTKAIGIGFTFNELQFQWKSLPPNRRYSNGYCSCP